VAVENLKAYLPFAAACERRRLPERNGKTIQLFTYDLFDDNTTPGTEGTVGTGIAPQTEVRSVSLKQYFDFISFSDLIVETAIDPIVENSAAELGYRAALTVNSLVITEFDVVGALSGGTTDIADGSYLTPEDVDEAVVGLRGDDVRPKSDGYFYTIVHPFQTYDLVNDNTSGMTSVLKYTESGQNVLQRGVQGFRVFDWRGARIIETTTVPTTADVPAAGKTAYSAYVVGQNAVFTVSLGATDVPGERNFRLMVKNYADADRADPAAVIGASCGYNFKFAAIRRPGTTLGLHRIRSEVSIS
jgi:N4-gp56 family major capsid protein